MPEPPAPIELMDVRFMHFQDVRAGTDAVVQTIVSITGTVPREIDRDRKYRVTLTPIDTPPPTG